MTRKQLRQMEVLGKVASFAKTHESRIPKESLASTTFDQLEAERTTIASLGALPGRSGSLPGTNERDVARQVLQDDLYAIHRTMLAVAIDHPGIEVNFRIPKGRRQDQRLIRAAQEFIKYATPLNNEFVAHQLVPNFLEKLASEAEALNQAIAAQAQATSERYFAAESLTGALDKGAELLLRLDAIVANMFGDDDEVMNAWKAARDVRKPGGRRKAAKPQPTNGNSETSVTATASESSPALFPHSTDVPEQPAVSSPA